MSFTMPSDAILEKFEETDPMILGNPDVADEYDQFMRAELIDQTPDVPHMEHEEQMDTSNQSKSILQNRYGGGRSGHYSMDGNHAEMFIGNMDVDPRGYNTDPNFSGFREHTKARFRVHKHNMGHNVGATDYIALEGPKTAIQHQKDRVELHRRAQKNMKWFHTSKDGQKRSANLAKFSTKARVMNMEHAAEGLGTGDSKKGKETTSRMVNQDTGMWRNTRTADFAIHRYTKDARGGRLKQSDHSRIGETASTHATKSMVTSQAPVHGAIANTMKAILETHRTQFQSTSNNTRNPMTTRKDADLIKAVYNAQQTQLATRSARSNMINGGLKYDSDTNVANFDSHGSQFDTRSAHSNMINGGLKYDSDTNVANFDSRGTQFDTRSARSNMINGGLKYDSDTNVANFDSRGTQLQTANARLANANRIAQVLAGNHKSDVYAAQRSTKKTGFMTHRQKFNVTRTNRTQSSDFIKSKFNSSYGVQASRANGLQVHSYSGINQSNTLGVVAEAKVGGFSGTSDSRKTRSRGSTKKDEFHGHTKDNVTLDADSSRVFGNSNRVGNGSGNFRFGNTGFRTNAMSDGGAESQFGEAIVS